MFTWVVDDMGPKKDLKNARRWTPTELDAFADVLADPGNNYAISLDKLALKKPLLILQYCF